MPDNGELPYPAPGDPAGAEALAGCGSEDRLGALRTHLDDAYDPRPPFGPAFAAGMACWAVANEAFAGETVEADAEQEFGSDYWPPCFFASAAEAGGATWEDTGDNTRRAEYWRWYLLDAVPGARDAE